jgi:hypothetical protein
MIINTKRDLHIHQINVITTFLYEFLNDIVYIVQSTMYKMRDDRVCYLRKTLYELKQSLKIWYDIIHDYLKKLEFKRIELNHEVFIFFDTEIIVTVYVNDLLLFESDIKEIRRIQNELNSRFQMTDLRELSHYLEIKIIISSDRNVITLKQRIYMKKVLTQFEMIDCNLVLISMKIKIINSLISINKKINLLNTKWY